MGRRHELPLPLKGAPFAARDARHLVTQDVLESAAYQRLCRGAYRAADDDSEVPYRDRVRGLLAVLPERTVLVGRTAAWAGGAWEPWPDDPVEVDVAPSGSVRRRGGVDLSAREYPVTDLVRTRWGLTTTPLRTALDLACHMRLETAVPVLDAVLAKTGLPREQVLARLDASRSGRGTRRARTTLAAVDPRSESPRESSLRLLVMAAGFTAPELQHEIRDAGGRLVARLDLAWPELSVAIEYDGWPHDDRVRHSRDLARHNALRALGWTVIQVDAAAFRRPEIFLAQLAAALGR